MWTSEHVRQNLYIACKIMKKRPKSMQADRLRSQTVRRAKPQKPAGEKKGADVVTAHHAIISADLVAHKQTEAAQWSSDERYQMVVEDLTEVICRFKADGTMLFVNEVCCRFFGKRRQDLLGKKWQPRVVPEDLPKIKALLRTLSPAHPVVVIENRVYSGSGEVRWMQFVNRGFFDAAGRLVETQAVGRDITERKQAEAKLHQSEAAACAYADELATVLAATPAITFIAHDPGCRRMTSSHAALRLLRLLAGANTSKSAPAGERPETFRTMKDGRELRPEELPVQRAAATGQAVKNFELTLVFADGTARDIVGDAIPLFNAEGKVRGAVGAFLDITERKRAESEVQRLASFPRFNPNPVLEVSFDGTVTYMNPTTALALKHLGLEDARSFIPQDWSAIVHAFLSGQTEPLQREVPIKDRLFAEWVCFAPGSDIARIYARDITEQRRAEAKVQAFSQEIVTAREEERKQVSAILHHDVGSLAVGVSAHLDAIEEDIRSGKPKEALRWVRRTRKLFGQSAARLKALAFRLRPPELDLLGLPAALRQYFSQMTMRKSTRIHFRENLERRQLSRDTATILFRVAQEALTNAIKHGRAKQVDVNLRASKQEISLTLANNGKEFDPSGPEAWTSSNMGLRVTREMVTGARGTFTVESGRGKGTTVCVTLPLQPTA